MRSGSMSEGHLSRIVEATAMRTEFVYLLTLTRPLSHAWELIGVFLDPVSAKNAKKYLIDQGIDAELIDIDHAPIGVVNTHGVDLPYVEGPVH